MPVVRQPGLEEEVLAREAQVLRGRAGDGMDLAEGPIDRLPDIRLRPIGEHDGPVEVIGMDMQELRGGSVDIRDDRQRHVVEPDVLAHCRAVRAVGLDQHLAGEVVGKVGRAGRRDVCGRADRKSLKRVIDIGADLRGTDAGARQPVPLVHRVVVGPRPRAAILRDVAGAVMGKGANRRACRWAPCDRGNPAESGRVVVGWHRRSSAGSDRIVIPSKSLSIDHDNLHQGASSSILWKGSCCTDTLMRPPSW